MVALISTGAACSSVGSTPSVGAPPATAAAADPAKAAEVIALVRPRSVIVKVSADGRQLVREARGDSMTGASATPEMSFRNGAVGISYVATLLLTLVDDGRVSLDDKVSRYLPDLNNADAVTVGQLARMTSGYPDYVTAPEFLAANSTDPFRMWTLNKILPHTDDKPAY